MALPPGRSIRRACRCPAHQGTYLAARIHRRSRRKIRDVRRSRAALLPPVQPRYLQPLMDPSGWRLDSDAFVIVAGHWWRTFLVRKVLLLLFFFSDLRSVCIALPFNTASSSTLPRTRLQLRALIGCSIGARGQAIIAGVAAFSGGGAIRCRSSSSWHSIQVRAYCRSRTDTAVDVAEGRPLCAFQLPGLPSPSAAYCPAAVLGQKLLILCTRAPR